MATDDPDTTERAARLAEALDATVTGDDLRAAHDRTHDTPTGRLATYCMDEHGADHVSIDIGHTGYTGAYDLTLTCEWDSDTIYGSGPAPDFRAGLHRADSDWDDSAHVSDVTTWATDLGTAGTSFTVQAVFACDADHPDAAAAAVMACLTTTFGDAAAETPPDTWAGFGATSQDAGLPAGEYVDAEFPDASEAEVDADAIVAELEAEAAEQCPACTSHNTVGFSTGDRVCNDCNTNYEP